MYVVQFMHENMFCLFIQCHVQTNFLVPEFFGSRSSIGSCHRRITWYLEVVTRNRTNCSLRNT